MRTKCRLILVIVVALVGLTVLPSPASADATAFLGFTTSPSNRSARGFGLGFGLLFAAFEFEYSSTSEEPLPGAPSLRTGSFNGLLQMPFEIARMQFYATAGGGVYREVLGPVSETNFAVNAGGGVKVSLAGPIRLRVDYRVFRLNGRPLHSNAQRLYAGLNLRF